MNIYVLPNKICSPLATLGVQAYANVHGSVLPETRTGGADVTKLLAGGAVPKKPKKLFEFGF
ncbi:MAG: hypothetical protein KDD19_16745 [Phaeodactylibacter sp.]|nr:hypothetical protein [Phaeodactylibacter sp.]MCB9048519.1 hypothetical protein [Lewinellaceae bacterium]